MTSHFLKSFKSFSIGLAVGMLLIPLVASSQTASNTSSSDKWLHVRVVSANDKGETVRVNVPLDLAEKVLPAINKDRLHNGKITIDHSELDGVDCRALLAALKDTKDGEFVTVQAHDSDVKVTKQGGYMLVHVIEKSWKEGKEGKDAKDAKEAKMIETSRVEVKVPMKVVEALFSAGKNELDVVAALRALSAHGDTELVSVKDGDESVRVWLDSKSSMD